MRRRDALPIWVAVVLGLFFLLRVLEVVPFHHAKPSSAQKASAQDASDAAMQSLIQADIAAKAAYMASLTRPDSVVTPDARGLHEALAAADTLQKETDNSPSAARRVMILRALVKSFDPPKAAAKDLPPLAMGKNRLDPLAAFGPALPQGVSASDRAAFGREGQVWKTVYGSEPLTPHQMTALAAQVQSLPNIRWWRWPALSTLYSGQGDLSQANRYELTARARGVPPFTATVLLGLLRFALGLAGVVILIYFGVRAWEGRRAAADAPPVPNLWPTVPERQPFSERKLGAGDLMEVFVVYLLTREVLEALLGGIPHVFPGLLAPYMAAIRAMPQMRRNTLEVVLEALLYVLSAVPPLGYLWAMARRRGASLANEIGWTRRGFGLNIGYGIAGYGVATPLMVAVGFLAPHLIRHAPEPSNPVIPEMVQTSGFWTTLILVLLASIAAPVVEELLFRGVFYNSVKLLVGTWPAIVLTGLVFGFVHPVGIIGMLVIAVLGGVFAWMAETRKSLVPSMTAHCLNNLVTTLILLFALSG